jgi:anthranilate/para-aminobenzoate synthase component I
MPCERFITMPALMTRPIELLAAWPAEEPIVLLHSGAHAAAQGTTVAAETAEPAMRWSRWSILARPAGAAWFDDTGWHMRCHSGVDSAPRIPAGLLNDPLGGLDAILGEELEPRGGRAAPEAPFAGGWIGALSYELGRLIEPAAQRGRSDEAATARRAPKPTGTGGWPLIALLWCPEALIYDHARSTWCAAGRTVERSALIHLAEGAAARAGARRAAPSFRAGPLRPVLSRRRYEASVARVIDYIAAGDVFQANLAQWFEAAFEGSPRAFATAALRRSGAWYGAYLELGEAMDARAEARAIVSMSPELFLQVNRATGEVITRPIKGTRPRSVDPRVLEASAKDTAELHMIMDLMRNDLGRVCEFGSIRVAEPRPRVIETHAGVHHGVGEVRGVLRRGVSTGELLRATFPGGSITGAPKIRAMQVIDELERGPFAGSSSRCGRGPYCGAIGFFGAGGQVTLNIAIRTALIEGRRLRYAAGAGIVADSQPAAEYRETLAKTAALQRALRPSLQRRTRPAPGLPASAHRGGQLTPTR